MNGRSPFIIPPPNYPMFMYKFFTSRLVKELIQWAKDEHLARLRYCAEHGYMRELKRLNEDYSPMRVLSELGNFGQICVSLSKKGWNDLTGRERVFIRRSFELKRLLRA